MDKKGTRESMDNPLLLAMWEEAYDVSFDAQINLAVRANSIS
jgi:hypothetical protein